MGKKNWIEFDNKENKIEEKFELETIQTISKVNISKQRKGKKGKTITLIEGLGIEDDCQIRQLLKKMKKFCGTGGTLIDNNIQLQGDMVSKSIEFLRNEGFQNL